MKKISISILAILAGGLLVAVGSLLIWSKVAIAMPGVGEESHSFTGMELDAGKVTLALGVLLAVVALVSVFLGGKARLGAGLALIGLAAGGFAAIWGVMFFTDIKEKTVAAVGEAAVASQGLGAEVFNEVAKKILMDASAVGAGWGLYLGILGGVVAFIGGLMALFELREAAAAPGDVASGVDEAVAAEDAVEGVGG